MGEDGTVLLFEDLWAKWVSGGVDIVGIGGSISGDMDDDGRRPRLGKVWNIRRFCVEAPCRQLLDGGRVCARAIPKVPDSCWAERRSLRA